MADKDRIRDVEQKLAKVARQIEGLPVRLGDSTSDTRQAVQLALIVSVVAAGDTDPDARYVPGTPPYELDFQIGGTGLGVGTLPVVGLVLLDVGDKLNQGAALEVYNPAGATLEAITFHAWDVRKDGAPRVGEVVRVWTSDGKPVKVPEGSSVLDGDIINPRHWVYCDPLNATDHLRSLGGYVTTTGVIKGLVAEEGILYWTDAFEGPIGPQGPQGDPGTPGDTVAAGYAIDIEGAGTVTVHNDPTEWSNFVAEWQLFSHLAAATTRTDPAWTTVDDYDGGVDQMWWHRGGGFRFETVDAYSTTAHQFLRHAPTVGADTGWRWETITDYDATKRQLLWHELGTWYAETLTNYDATKRQFLWHQLGTWEFETIADYDGAATQILGHVAGSWALKTIAQWLNLLPGYVAGNDQSIGHDASGVTQWQDDGDC